MAITLTTGSTLSVAKTYAASLNFTAATNASPCALTVSGSTIVAGDYVEVSSGWGLLDKRLVRAGAGARGRGPTIAMSANSSALAFAILSASGANAVC